MTDEPTKATRKPPTLVALSPAEQNTLAASLRGQGRPVGAWIGRRYGAAPATVLGAALGLPVREGTAALLRARLASEGKGAI